ncbi:phosphonoacetaldehyde hydrolase [Rubrivivax gelatinosus]|uniref:phosphonoacetaldehyde hydrolase n=1 Tax=Rubrivivax gelatinosus TaxID=28068 RepID=UPI001902E8F2|nr:phosphonoacetaldehyde hydrolase [Rubrivivax gelatinosus]MBK1613258.1 phosphonoacetaldehyde hydrolase [Rubrivivax gelatinosus]
MGQQLEAVILDWAGTVVDFGSFAPTQIFVDAFKTAYDFELTLAEARRPMGLGKWQHIEALGRDPEVGARWQAQFGRTMSHEDVDALYHRFVPLQVERVGQHGELIPGALATLQALRARGLKIGSTTGYPRAVMHRLMEVAASQGYVPDCTVCADDLPAGARPGPWMALDNVQQLAIGSVAHCVKVDDTLPGLHEGRNAGMWTVGLALSGSPCGWTLDEYLAAGELERDAVRQRVAAEFAPARPHYVVDTVASLPAVLEDIEARLAAGDRP